ncbi:MAG: hypothetical protein ACXWHF_06080 [Chthoniobacterales bacterium]
MMDPTTIAKPKRWPVALLVGLISGIVGATISAPVADWAMESHHVSNFEGGRGYAVVCLWIPLGFIVSFIVGFVVSLLIKQTGFVGYLIKQGVALVIVALLVAAGAGLGYATADHPPLVDGQNLALEIEVRVPKKGRSIEDLKKADFSVALVVSTSDRSYSDMRWAEATESNEFITVPAWADLNSRNAEREITAGVEGESRQIFNVLRLASPKIDEAWSDWTPPRERFDNSKPSPEDQYLVRYRVRFTSEYSPTPRPMTEYQAAPSPEESPAAETSPSPNETSTP